jgi:ABC-type multidrug transport system permease subunit
MVLSSLALLQVTVLFVIVKSWCGPPGSPIGQWFALAGLALAGTALGLLISAFARSEETAIALVPLTVMPQIILAGVIAPLTGPALWLANMVTAHSGQMALESLLPDADLRLLQLHPASWAASMGAVCSHGIVFALGTFAILLWRDSHRKL